MEGWEELSFSATVVGPGRGTAFFFPSFFSFFCFQGVFFFSIVSGALCLSRLT
jgi:hypothetical protein